MTFDTFPFTSVTSNDGRLRTNTVFIFKYVSKVFVRNFSKSLNREKATWLNELPAGMLKDCYQHLINLMHHIINLSFQWGHVEEKLCHYSNLVIKTRPRTIATFLFCQLCLNCWKSQCTPKYEITLKKMDFWIIFNLDIKQRDLHNLPQR